MKVNLSLNCSRWLEIIIIRIRCWIWLYRWLI